jgi:New glue protein family
VARLRTSRFPILAALVAVLGALFLSACGGSSSPSASVAGTTTSTTSGAGAGANGSSTTTTSTSKSSGASGKDPGSSRRHTKRALPARAPGARRRRTRVRVSHLRACLLANGIDPLRRGQKGASRQKLQGALARCGNTVRTQRRQVLSSPKYRAALKSFTSCMRSHGVPHFPEPNTSGNGPVFGGARLTRNPQMRTASRACIHLLRVARTG